MLACVALLAAYFLWMVRGGLYPFVIAFFLAYVLNPAVGYLEGKGMKRVWAIACVYFLLFTGLFVVGSRLVPVFVRELESFGQDLPQMTAKGEELIISLQSQYQQSALPHSLRSLSTTACAPSSRASGVSRRRRRRHCARPYPFCRLGDQPGLAFYLLHDWHELIAAVLRTLPPAGATKPSSSSATSTKYSPA
jgi:predicted PurR-regulated permease PerM